MYNIKQLKLHITSTRLHYIATLFKWQRKKWHWFTGISKDDRGGVLCWEIPGMFLWMSETNNSIKKWHFILFLISCFSKSSSSLSFSLKPTFLQVTDWFICVLVSIATWLSNIHQKPNPYNILLFCTKDIFIISCH